MTSSPTDLVLPSASAFDELRALGYEVYDPLPEQQRRRAFRVETIRLARLRAVPVCGMTSRGGDLTDRRGHQRWFAGDVLTPSLQRFAGFEVAAECLMWSTWLVSALDVWRRGPGGGDPVPLAEVAAEIHPPPPPRPFYCPTWPNVGLGGPMPKRRARARRS